jgi:dienelactone hydrolase
MNTPKGIWQIAIGTSLILILSLSLPAIASASGPEDDPGPTNDRMMGLASDAVDCLAVGAEAPAPALGTVKLAWQGQARLARLIINVAGSEAAHTVKVNGHPVAKAPAYPDGQPCGAGEVFYLYVSPAILVQGDNLIEITNDALTSDNWTAADVRLEVLGDITPVVAEASGQLGQAGVAANAATLFTFDFTNAYDGSLQEARAQIPNGHNGSTPAPLLVVVHPRSSDMFFGEDRFGTAANNRGWLLTSPQLHGSWPDGLSPAPPDPPGKYAYASLESQYDTIGAIKYMIDQPNYNVDLNRIYLVGYSMGGQGGVVTAAKFPHLFAAAFDNKGPTDMVVWYDEQVAFYPEGAGRDVVKWMRRECHIDGQLKTPAQNPFCYQRRSGLNFASNYIHVPISVTHSLVDALVPYHHSPDLVAAINSNGPDQTATVFADTVIGPTCTDGGANHCYEPDPDDVLDFLEPYALNNDPTHINITTDESKSYYWLDIDQMSANDRWSHVDVSYDSGTQRVTATIFDSQPLSLGFNLGSELIGDDIISQITRPGMGLLSGFYSVEGGGNADVVGYDNTSGYLYVTASSATVPYVVTISLLEPTDIGDVKAYLPVIFRSH